MALPSGMVKYVDVQRTGIRRERKAKIITRETVDTRFGRATYAYIAVDNFAPCASVTVIDGKRTIKRAKAHIFGYRFDHNGFAYSVLFRKSYETSGNRVGNLPGFREKRKIRLDAFFKPFKITQGG